MEHSCKFIIQRGSRKNFYCDVIVNKTTFKPTTTGYLCPFHKSIQKRLDVKKRTRTWAVAVTPTQEDSIYKYYKFPKKNYEEVEYFEENNEEWIKYSESSVDGISDDAPDTQPEIEITVGNIKTPRHITTYLVYQPDPASSLSGVQGLYQIENTDYIIKQDDIIIGKACSNNIVALNETEKAEVITMGFSVR